MLTEERANKTICKPCYQIKYGGAKKLREKRQANHLCVQCGKVPVDKTLRCDLCREKNRNHVSLRIKKRRQQGLCYCGKPLMAGYSKCEECNKKVNEYSRNRRIEVLNHYGGKCSCCGETKWYFLEIDHINNNGGDHRREIGRAHLFDWLRARKFPEGYQVLCANCHMAKTYYGGRCPCKDVNIN